MARTRLKRVAIRTNVNDGFNEFDRPVTQNRPEERQSRLAAMRFTPDELRKVKQAAKSAKLSVSEYIRMKLGLRGGK